MFPYLDVAGFRRRTIMAPGEVAYLEDTTPGYLASRIAVRSSYINGRLRKRYGNAPGIGNSLPLGQTAPVLMASGEDIPQVTLQGRPVLGSLEIQIVITGGVTFRWSSDGGITFPDSQTAIPIAASVSLVGTGLTAYFPTAGATYTLGDTYQAATPVPEIVLGWLTTMVTWDGYQRRGVNPQDVSLEFLKAELDTALAEIKEAADSKDGLFDLPVSEDLDSAVTTGGPLGYSETSPYAWQDIEVAQGRAEDSFYARSGGRRE